MPELDQRIGLAFSYVDKLVSLLGPWQPWVAVPMYPYVGFLRANGVRMLQVDPVNADGIALLPAEQWWSDRGGTNGGHEP
jgi:hypothetical protein